MRRAGGTSIRLGRFAASALALAAAAAWPAGAQAGPTFGTPQYPDLRTLPPAELQLRQVDVGGTIHHEVRFSTVFANLGQGPLELHGRPHFPPDGLYDAIQRIYESPFGFQETPVGTFAYHHDHRHFHFDDFARYELWTGRSFDRALAHNFTRGRPMAVIDKVSFCVFDSRQVDPTPPSPPRAVYSTCTPFLEGISVGWADRYGWSVPGQGFDVGTSPLPDGDYVIRTVVDPSNRLWESPGKADPARESDVANHGYTRFSMAGGALVVGS